MLFRSEKAVPIPTKATPSKTTKPKGIKPNSTSKSGEKITLTSLRQLAAPIAKAGKAAQLQKLFIKYDAQKISEVKPEAYASLKADLEALNG